MILGLINESGHQIERAKAAIGAKAAIVACATSGD